MLAQAVNTGTKYEVLERKSMEEITNYKVSSIPAIRIDKKVNFSLGKEESINEFLDRVNAFLTTFKKKEIMKKIIVPTDFSATSENAVEYAAQLGRVMGRKLKMTHFFHPAPVSAGADVLIDAKIEEIKKNALSHFQDSMRKKLEDSIGIIPKIETEFNVGFPVETAKRVEQEEEHAFWVLGSKGEGFSKRWLGSTSLSLASELTQPVFIIPTEAKFKPIRKIGFAIDDLNKIPSSLEWLSGFSTQFEAKIFIINVNDQPHHNANEIVGKLQHDFPLNEFAFIETKALNVPKEINRIATDNDFDLLVVSKKSRGFFEKLFLKSVSNELAISSTLPLLVLHH